MNKTKLALIASTIASSALIASSAFATDPWGLGTTTTDFTTEVKVRVLEIGGAALIVFGIFFVISLLMKWAKKGAGVKRV